MSRRIGRCDRDRVIVKARHQIKSPTQSFYVANDRIEGRHRTAFDLRHTTGSDSHHVSQLRLREAMTLALLSEPMSALASHQRLAALFGFPLATHTLDVRVAIPLLVAAHGPATFSTALLQIDLVETFGAWNRLCRL